MNWPSGVGFVCIEHDPLFTIRVSVLMRIINPSRVNLSIRVIGFR